MQQLPITEKVNESLYIQGITHDGKVFRPSDWAERLCGVMACFRPGNEPHAHLYYSAYVRPVMLEGVKSVMVNCQLEEIEPTAYRFLVGFAKDNELKVVQAKSA